MDNLKIQVKDIHSSQLGWMPLLTALDKWLNHGGVEIARDPDIVEFESDAEREQAARIVCGIWNVMAENPRTEYAMNKQKLDALEEDTLAEIKHLNFPIADQIEKRVLLDYLQTKFPTHDRDTIRRRIDSIVEKGHLDRLKEGSITYYRLKAQDKFHKELLA